jgi:hypothetical protein
MDNPQSRIRNWVSLMQRYGIQPPPEVQRAALPRTQLGTFGGWAARSAPPPPAATPVTPAPPRPRWQGFAPDARRIGPGAAARPRAFPVRNAPWGEG